MVEEESPFGSLPPLTRYARVLAALARTGADPDVILEQFGLTEAEWESLEVECDGLLDAEELSDEQVLERLGIVASELAPRPSKQEPPSLGFEAWQSLTRSFQAGVPLEAELRAQGVSLHDFLKAQAYWLRRLWEDPELLARYAASDGRQGATATTINDASLDETRRR